MKTFDGYKKRNLTDDNVLLAGGGHKSIEELLAECSKTNHNHDNRYLRWSNASADTAALGWGTLTAANGYNILSHARSSDGGDMGWVYKNGQISYLLDGFFYLNEGKYRLTDVSETVTALSTSGNYITWTKNGVTNNITIPYATISGAISNLNNNDIASNNDTWRKVWISYANGITGRPALSDSLVFLASTGTLKAPIFQGNLNGNATSATLLNYYKESDTSADNLAGIEHLKWSKRIVDEATNLFPHEAGNNANSIIYIPTSSTIWGTQLGFNALGEIFSRAYRQSLFGTWHKVAFTSSNITGTAAGLSTTHYAGNIPISTTSINTATPIYSHTHIQGNLFIGLPVNSKTHYLRLLEYPDENSEGYLGAFINYDGIGNYLNIGTNSGGIESDYVCISIQRDSHQVTFTNTPYVGNKLVSLNGHTHSLYLTAHNNLVNLSSTTTSNYRGFVFSYNSDTTHSTLENNVNNVVYVSNKIYGQPSTGNVYANAFYATSDIRFKNIEEDLIVDVLQISKLPLFNFTWNNGTDGKHSGTSAQEVMKILPNLVSGDEMLTLNYATLGTITGITACKELVAQKSEIDLLKERIKELELQLKMINDYGRC